MPEVNFNNTSDYLIVTFESPNVLLCNFNFDFGSLRRGSIPYGCTALQDRSRQLLGAPELHRPAEVREWLALMFYKLKKNRSSYTIVVNSFHSDELHRHNTLHLLQPHE
jgi:hypothetical protein